MHETARRSRAVRAARAAGADALLVTHGPDVRYLSGFTGSSGAVALAGGRAALFTDGRYIAQARNEARGLRVVIDKKPPAVLAMEWLAKVGASRCAFDAGRTTVAALAAMRKGLPSELRRKFLLPTDGVVAKLREVKDEDEIARMRRAAALGCRLFESVLEHIVAGATEAEVAAALEFQARTAGAEAMSFETIVASGARSALPHGRATGAKLPRRGFVTLDFGVLLEGYCSDMTRTVHLGRANPRERDVYDSVLEAQQAAVAAVQPAVPCGDVDEAARSVLRKAGLDKAFSHSTGHGVGLEIHEGPRIAAAQKQVLRPGMVITIEPGVYLANGDSLHAKTVAGQVYPAKADLRRRNAGVLRLHPSEQRTLAGDPACAQDDDKKRPGLGAGRFGSAEEFGIRIEDMVLVTEAGGEVLTKASSKEWMEI